MSIYVKLSHFAVQRRLAQHCKSTIPQFKKKTQPLKTSPKCLGVITIR